MHILQTYAELAKDKIDVAKKYVENTSNQQLLFQSHHQQLFQSETKVAKDAIDSVVVPFMHNILKRKHPNNSQTGYFLINLPENDIAVAKDKINVIVDAFLHKIDTYINKKETHDDYVTSTVNNVLLPTTKPSYQPVIYYKDEQEIRKNNEKIAKLTDELTKFTKQLNELKQHLVNKTTELNNKTTELNNKTVELNNKTTELIDLKKQVNDIKTHSNELKQHSNELTQQLVNTTTELTNTKRSLVELKQQSDNKNIKITDFKRQITQLQSDNKTQISELNALLYQIEQLKEEMRKLQQDNDDIIAKADKQHTSTQEQITNLQHENKKLLDENENITTQLNNEKRKTSHLTDQNRIVTARHDTIKNEYDTLATRHIQRESDYKANDERFNQTYAENKKMSQELSDLKTQYEALLEKNTNLSHNIDEIKDQNEQIKQENQKLLDENKQNAGELIEATNAFSKQVEKLKNQLKKCLLLNRQNQQIIEKCQNIKQDMLAFFTKVANDNKENPTELIDSTKLVELYEDLSKSLEEHQEETFGGVSITSGGSDNRISTINQPPTIDTQSPIQSFLPFILSINAFMAFGLIGIIVILTIFIIYCIVQLYKQNIITINFE